MGKHAYLIMAHSNMNQLKNLVRCLDSELNDIYIHVDKKYKDLNPDDVAETAAKSKISFCKRISVNWGGYSLVEARFLLLECAHNNGPYDFYHFLSGQDLPLQPQSSIHKFFDEHKDEEFISIGPEDDWYLKRVKYFWPFRDVSWGRTILGRIMNNGFYALQMLLRVNMIKNSKIKFYNGEEWFSVTERFVEYALSMKDFCDKVFKYGDRTDEMVFPTIYMMWPGANRRYVSPYKSEIFNSQRMDVLRAIDWDRGKPYTYRVEDYDLLKNSHCLFARKFNEDVDSKIIERITADVIESNAE